MNSTELMLKYKHDTIGQFRDLKTAIEDFHERDFACGEKLEVFLAIHAALEKMLSTSEFIINTIGREG